MLPRSPPAPAPGSAPRRAASTSMPMLLEPASAAPPRPSACAWALLDEAAQRGALRLRAASEPEKANRARVAPAITNQVLTSWLLATSPRSSASSSRFWVGSSVFRCRRVPRPWRSLYDARRELVQHALEIAEERAHHGADDQEQDDEADEDRQRQADEEHLHLRHQPRQHAEAEIEQEAEHQERRRRAGRRCGRRRRSCA